MLPDMAESMSSSVGLGFDESNDTACMIWPGWRKPHCGTFTSAQAFCTACGPCVERDSMVVISRPSTVLICFEQERIAFPFCRTVQVPQQRHLGIAVESLSVSVHLEMNHCALPGMEVGKLRGYCTATGRGLKD